MSSFGAFVVEKGLEVGVERGGVVTPPTTTYVDQ